MTQATAVLERTKTVPGLRGFAWIAGAPLLGFLIVLLRGKPAVTGDQGIFVSIAARMLDGDHLYSQVVDNKDPLFFYTYAAALWIGGWRAPSALDGLWLAFAAVGFALLMHQIRAPRPAVIAGFFMYPLALTIGWYEPGLSMLAGLSIVPFVAWCWLREKYIAAGAVLGIVMLFKLSVVLVAAGPIAAFVLLGVPIGSRGRHVAKAALGVVATIGVGAAALALRGELKAYLNVLAYDAYYRDEGLEGRGKSAGIIGHLGVVRDFMGTAQTVAAVLVFAVFVVAAYLGRNRGGRSFRAMTAAAVLTLIATLFTLALTAIWPHHLQMLAFPLALIAGGLIWATQIHYGHRAGVIAAGVCVLFLVLASVKDEVNSGVPTSQWFSSFRSAPADALETARMRFYGRLDQVTYMHFGQNDEDSHAAFLSNHFELTCARFHQYPHDPADQLTKVLNCVTTKKPLLIFVTPSLFDLHGSTPQWDTFVPAAERLLHSRYRLVSNAPAVQVWKRRQPVSAA
jgi:hypothetical protein